MRGSDAGQTEATRDHHALHLTGTFADLQDLGIPVEARHREVLHEPVATEDLGRDAGGSDGRLSRVQLGHRCGLLDLFDGAASLMELVLEPGGLVGQQARRLDHHLQVGDLERDPLVGPDRPAEGDALLGVVGRQLEAGLGQPDGQGADRDPPVIEGLEELAVAGALLAEQAVSRHTAVVEEQAMGVGDVPAELVVRRLDSEPGGAGRDQDRADLGRAVRVLAGTGRDGHHGGDVGAAVRDEGLGAVDHPLIALEPGPGAGGTGVRAGLGLGQAKGRQRPAGDQIGQPLLLLLLRAVGKDRVDAQPDTGRQCDADGLVDPPQLLDGHAQAGEVTVGAPELLGHHKTEQPQATHLGDEVDREMLLAIPPGNVRSDLRLGELAHDGAEVFVVLAELEHLGALRWHREPVEPA